MSTCWIAPRLPGLVDRRQPCSNRLLRATHRCLRLKLNRSLASRARLNVFGPYTEKDAAIDKSQEQERSGLFPGRQWQPLSVRGRHDTGSTRARLSPCRRVLARLRVIAERGKPAYLRVRSAGNDRDDGEPRLIR